MGYPEKCNICVRQGIHKEMGDVNLRLSVDRPYQTGKKPRVMLVGLNPTLIEKMAKAVLELDDERSRIYDFTFNDVLLPAGINKQDVYATNLVKCTFSKEPRIICRELYGKDVNETVAVKRLLSPFFQNCKKYLAEEIREERPKLLISFGKKTHELIVEEYGLLRQGVKKNLSEAFGNAYPVTMNDQKVIYIPCIRERVKNRRPFVNRWDNFITTLKESMA